MPWPICRRPGAAWRGTIGRQGRRRRRALRVGGARPDAADTQRRGDLPGRGHLRRARVPALSLRVPATLDGVAIRRHGLRHPGRGRDAAASPRPQGGVPGGRWRLHDDGQ
ncbi:hypothetical protein G6F22_018564 [Rhizopus arrhizus]|nr:hypothetical protein G6F22_018564 [Rhizopus arrhizus]